jgi:hypothetical protein
VQLGRALDPRIELVADVASRSGQRSPGVSQVTLALLNEAPTHQPRGQQRGQQQDQQQAGSQTQSRLLAGPEQQTEKTFPRAMGMATIVL